MDDGRVVEVQGKCRVTNAQNAERRRRLGHGTGTQDLRDADEAVRATGDPDVLPRWGKDGVSQGARAAAVIRSGTSVGAHNREACTGPIDRRVRQQGGGRATSSWTRRRNGSKWLAESRHGAARPAKLDGLMDEVRISSPARLSHPSRPPKQSCISPTASLFALRSAIIPLHFTTGFPCSPSILLPARGRRSASCSPSCSSAPSNVTGAGGGPGGRAGAGTRTRRTWPGPGSSRASTEDINDRDAGGGGGDGDQPRDRGPRAGGRAVVPDRQPGPGGGADWSGGPWLDSAKANAAAADATASRRRPSSGPSTCKELDQKVLSLEELDRRHFAAANADAKQLQARADMARKSRRQISQTQTELDRRIVRAQVDGTVLQCKVHLGEFAPAGPVDPPLMMLGGTDTLNVRVDVDENDAWRVAHPPPGRGVRAGATSDLSTKLAFVRLEPFVLPKKSLTGDSAERVDTRVLQVLYSFDPQVPAGLRRPANGRVHRGQAGRAGGDDVVGCPLTRLSVVLCELRVGFGDPSWMLSVLVPDPFQHSSFGQRATHNGTTRPMVLRGIVSRRISRILHGPCGGSTGRSTWRREWLAMARRFRVTRPTDRCC